MVKRGEVWTVSGGSDFAGKPRPSVIVQHKLLGQVDSVTVCPMTSCTEIVSPSRVLVRPDEENGLRHCSHIMVEKISTVKTRKLGQRLGVLAPSDLIELEWSLLWYLGLLPSDDGHSPSP